MTVLVVTGTSTDVGKTVVTAALAAVAEHAGYTVAVCKPAQTGIAPGEPGDLADVTRLSGVSEVVELARYPEPLGPVTAARRANMALLTLAEVVAAIEDLDSRHDVVMVEGAGGVLVRLGADFTVIDVARSVGAAVVVVTAAGLGTLNHSELTVRAIEDAAVTCAGLIIGSWPHQPGLAERCNRDDLGEVTGAALLGAIPEGVGSLERGAFIAAAPDWVQLPV
ncbi:MAG: ATP-dependent dethiobiotin synthetase BioD [Rhodococcus sp.]|nr:ATP-dependent dethiobiotin synthetase BioD [Rhodococcus sp. (in: high G+C Gram-positive bacteria)]